MKSKAVLVLLLVLAVAGLLSSRPQVAATPPGLTLTATTGYVLDVIGISDTGFAGDTSCNINTTPQNITSPSPASSCSVSVTGQVTASLKILGTASPSSIVGIYTITVTGTIPGDSASATFQVLAPTITALTPSSGSAGTQVFVAGHGFKTSDAGPCSFSGPIVNSNVSSYACQITASSDLSGTYFHVISGAPSGLQPVNVLGSSGDSASTQFAVSSPSITLTPNSAPVGTAVSVSGNQFSSNDHTCSITSSPSSIIAVYSCAISSGVLSGSSFTVKTGVSFGTYSITVEGNTGDFGSTSFQVNATSPAIALSSLSGSRGMSISVSGSGFNPTDNGCSITSTPTNIMATPTCHVTNGQLTGSFFTVATSAPVGSYTVTVTGTTEDFAEASLQVLGAVISFSSPSGSPSDSVTVSGSGFSPADATCSLSGQPVASSPAPSCLLNGGTLTGSFVVANVGTTTASYIVTATGNVGQDSASALFSVVINQITVTLSSYSGLAGSTITVAGSGFKATDTSCTISGSPVSSQSCSVSGGAITSASFVVSNIAAGTYPITVTGYPSGNVGTVNFVAGQTGTSGAYTISFFPTYWTCGESFQVTLSGPVIPGDKIEFDYYQYEQAGSLSFMFSDTEYPSSSSSITYTVQTSEWEGFQFYSEPYVWLIVKDLTVPSGNTPVTLYSNAVSVSPQSCNVTQGPYTTTVPGTSTSWVYTETSTGTLSLTSTVFPWIESDTSTSTIQSNVLQTQITYTTSTSNIWTTNSETFTMPATVTNGTVTETYRSTSSYIEQVRVGAFSTPLWQLGLVAVFGVALGATKSIASYFDKGKQKKGKFKNETDEERKKRTIAQGQRKFRDQFLSLAHRGKLPADAKRPQPQHEHLPADVTVQQGPPEFEHQVEPVQAVSLGLVLDKILEPPAKEVNQEPVKDAQENTSKEAEKNPQKENAPKDEEKPKETPQE